MTDSSNDLYFKVLTIAATNEGLPYTVDDDSIAPFHIFDELVQMNCLNGKRVKFFGGRHHYENLQITGYGRQYLQQITTVKEEKSIKTTAKKSGIGFLKWVLIGIGGILLMLLGEYLKKKFIKP
jgi:hypothetical protein